MHGWTEKIHQSLLFSRDADKKKTPTHLMGEGTCLSYFAGLFDPGIQMLKAAIADRNNPQSRLHR